MTNRARKFLKRLGRVCFACGSEYLWGCEWCSPHSQGPVKGSEVGHNLFRDDDAFLMETKALVGLNRAHSHTERFHVGEDVTA